MNYTHSKSIQNQFQVDGFLLLKGFYPESYIDQIVSDVKNITRVVSENTSGDDISGLSLPEHLSRLSNKNRPLISTIYDAAKMLPSVHRVINHPKNFELFNSLRPNSMPGIATNGHGIRIDLPNEERFSAPWHQEFPNQFRSLDGLVFWTPLMRLSQDLGPVHILPGSHQHGVFDVELASDDIKSGAYAMNIKDIQTIISASEREVISPICEKGDLIIINFLTLHKSGQNISDRARMSLQFRLFNFLDPIGKEINWSGSYASGRDFSSVQSLVKSLK